ncbi:hypothetical protein BOX15_Mlig030036g2 [Macrostomum lignano]|uniref:Poly [ADP-ribose] polymerase n=2 Tax=Macrostomum lignano TaxID=282301 RepID=A0A1I8HKT8_9PLAT|nr:hypothetical protein BOX15_Mlig030036g2 [Macrostomum lignano]
MPPKRKAAAAKAAGKGAKKAKATEPAKPALEKKSTLQKALSVAKKVAATSPAAGGSGKVNIKVDIHVPNSSMYKVHQDYDAMLNQTNIGQNNNKFYVIQVLERGSVYYAFNRWGRVGEPGQKSLKQFGSAAAAIADFEKKFSDKTRNKWADRAKFSPVKGKYTLLEMSYDDEEDDTAKKVALLNASGGSAVQASFESSKLDAQTQRLMDLIFSSDMFRNAMEQLKIDVKKMPLGKLSKAQIAKGFEVLEELEREMDGTKKKAKLTELSSKFYTVVPHNFGRLVPPVIQTKEALREKLDMLLVLSDIVVAQSLQKENEMALQKQSAGKKPNPMDINYESLKCKLEPVDPKSQEFKVIETYQKQTGGVGKILQAWRVDREGEEERHVKAGDVKLDNRKLLWHGTNVAVVAAILKSGLRIMPHSGGRVGRGIYFASEQGKSACYTSRATGNQGIMFLNEVALGKICKITVGNSSYTAAPPGFNSILAEGRTEPDPSQDTTLAVGSRVVKVPQGKPKPIGPSSSHFSQSEYLVYKESQCRIRYLLRMQF